MSIFKKVKFDISTMSDGYKQRLAALKESSGQDSYSREEVIQLLRDILMDSHELTSRFPDGTTNRILSDEDALFNKGFESWIKENL